MALKGTIRDFGVADIFQLVSQQVKTGILLFSNDIDSVKVFFLEGAVVHAESATKSPDRMLGMLLVRAEVINQSQLDQALAEQQRTLQRLAQVLLDLRYVSQPIVKEFATLQLTETVYALFEWTDGTYQFDADDVTPSLDGVEPVRADNFVLDAIRHIDEWPAIRERIPSYQWVVEQIRELPASSRTSDVNGERDGAHVDFDLESSRFGSEERRVFDLIGGGRTVQKLIDLSRMGEFETCQALSTLMQNGFVRLVKPSTDARREDDAAFGPWGRHLDWLRPTGRILVSAGTVLLTAYLLASTSRNLAGRGEQDLEFRPDPVAERLANTQIKVLRRALEVYRYQTGSYPLSLDELVEGKFVAPRDVRYPFDQPYFYRVNEGGAVVLLPPVR